MSMPISLTEDKIRPAFPKNSELVNSSEISEFSKYIPDYMFKLKSELSSITKTHKFMIFLPLNAIKLYVYALTWNWEKCVLGLANKLTLHQVDFHYTKIASNYEKRHNKITHSHDTEWRKQIGIDAAMYLKTINESTRTSILLDICTGTGLSLKNIIEELQTKGLKVKAYGLDYNNEMLKIAKEQTLPQIEKSKQAKKDRMEIVFLRGNATVLISKNDSSDELSHFVPNSIDCITNLCGIGGIEDHNLSFKEQLMILRPGGVLIMHDMHRPVPNSNSHQSTFLRFCNLLKNKIWEDITVQIILKELWAWTDPTSAFYVLPLVSYFDYESNKYYGFKTLVIQTKTELWEFSLPLVFTAKIIVKKIEISYEEHKRMESALPKVGEFFSNIDTKHY